MSFEVVPYTGDVVSRAKTWTDLDEGERKRRAATAARDRSLEDLWSLTEAHLMLYGKAGAHLSPNSRRAYRGAIAALLTAWSGENLLHPQREAAPLWLRASEAAGLKPATIQVHLAGARALYRALRWSGATDADPFADARPARDPTPAWGKRKPYSDADVSRLLEVAEGEDRVLILLAGHAGLRVFECLRLEWRDIDFERRTLTVREGKGRKTATVQMSRTLTECLRDLSKSSQNIPQNIPLKLTSMLEGYVISEYRSQEQARYRLRALCRKTGTTWRGVHALRHACGTKLQRELGDISKVARHLRHSSTATTETYVHFAEDALESSVGDW